MIIHLADCLGPRGMVTLEPLSVDVTITDPPYEAEAHTKGKRQNPTKDGHDRVVDNHFDFDAITDEQRRMVALHIGRVTKSSALVFCQAEAITKWKDALEAGGLNYRRTIPWVKPDAMPSLHGRWPGQSWEAIVLAMRKGAKAPVGGKARYYQETREREGTRAHPTAKPLRLMRQIVEDFSNSGDLICDPFAGSGTTGAAARLLGRDFVGWELNEEYHGIATRRLAGEEAMPVFDQMSLPLGLK